MNFVINLPPVTKKNSQQIITVKGRPMIIPSKKYREYEKDASWFLRYDGEPIDYPVEVKCLFYMPTRRTVDISNLTSAIHDVLVTCRILKDDNRNIIYSTDGSRVYYDKDNPRTEITITPIAKEEFESWEK